MIKNNVKEFNEKLNMIGRIIAEKRKEMGLKQSDIYEATGIQMCTISRLENGKYSPGFVTLYTICKYLDLDIALK